jgi:hypothetical protein
MKRLASYLRRLLKDVLFHRVSVALYSAPLAASCGYVFIPFHPTTGVGWAGWVLLLVSFVWFTVVLWFSVFGSDAQFERVTKSLDGGELPFVLLVMVAAVPVTAVLKVWRR